MSQIQGIDTLSKFGTVLSGSAQKQKFMHLKTRYRVKFIGFANSNEGEDLTLSMKNFDTPKGNFEDQKIDLVNGEIHYPGKWTWDAVNFKVYNTYDNSAYRALQDQLQRQRDMYNQVTGDAPSTYKFTTIFEHTDGHQDTLSMWVMEGCYLTKADSDGGENNSHDALTIDCSMRIDNATLYDADGLKIPSSNAGIITDPIDALYRN